MRAGLDLLVHGFSVGSLLISSIATAGIITFNPEASVVAGSGCPQGSTDIYLDDFGDLNIDYHSLAIQLGGNTSALAQRKACVVRIPVHIPHGYYMKTTEQQLIYGVRKSSGSSLKIASRAAVSGDKVTPLTVDMPLGSVIAEQSKIDYQPGELNEAQQIRKYCESERSEDTIFQINVAVSAQRSSVRETVQLKAYSQILGEGMELEVAPCPGLLL